MFILVVLQKFLNDECFCKIYYRFIISVLCFSTNAQGYVDTTAGVIIDTIDDIIDVQDFAFDDEEPPMMFVEEMPEFPGGPDSLNAFLSREIQYPLVAKNNGITGTVLVEFVVEKDGRVTNGKVKVPLFPECDVEALRGVMPMPKWKPGKNMGKTVRCYFQVPVTFQL